MYLNSSQYLVLTELLTLFNNCGSIYALYGTGKVAMEILCFIQDKKLPLPCAVIDHNEFTEPLFCGVPFVHINRAEPLGFDSVIIATNIYHTEMRTSLASKRFKVNFDVYNLDRGIFEQIAKIDVHHHIMLSSYSKGIPYIEKIYHEIQRKWNVKKICIFPAGLRSNGDGICGNDTVNEVAERFPDIFIPFASFNLGYDSPELIDTFADQGFKGIKFISPAAAYGAEMFYDVYRKVSENNLIAVFHTGISVPIKQDTISLRHVTCSNWHRAIYLENVAHNFPDMKIICSHFGAPWIDDIIYLIRFFPNVYADLSASLYMGAFTVEHFAARLRGMEPEVLSRKIMFGTDVPPEGYLAGINLYERVFKELKLDLHSLKRIMNDNFEDLLRK